VVEEGGAAQIVVRPRCYVTLTLDHRVMDGDQANHFMRVLVQRLNEWRA
jgi:2-oxoglutarate dehydrogenase E2 component (dihydrolipoamide succinyltransferase)